MRYPPGLARYNDKIDLTRGISSIAELNPHQMVRAEEKWEEQQHNSGMKLFNLMTSKGVVAVIVSLYDAVI